MMSGLLKSEYDTALYHSNALTFAAALLNTFSPVGAGETNHGINDTCCSIYNETAGILQSYYNAAQRDGERIKAVADKLTDLDLNMSYTISDH